MFKYSSLVKFFFVFFSILSGCSKEPPQIPDFYRSYFPDNVGHWVSYQVDSLYWNDFYQPESPEFHDTVSYQIKERIESVFIDNQGRPALRLERYYRRNASEAWRIKDIWSMVLTNTYALKNEENIPYVKLIFPIKKNARWNGNLYNTFDAQDYKYSSVHTSYNTDFFTVDSAVFVTQRADSSLIDCNYFLEIYGNHIGLVYKRMRHLETEVDGTIIKGYDCTYKAMEYGKN